MAKKSNGKKGDPLIGAIVDRRWHVLEQLGAGGMGVVYLAERVGIGKQVALKFLHQSVAESKGAVARFEREAKAISRLHHVHCVSILDFGVYRKQPYIVMEFVQGRQLSELDMEAMTPNRAVTLMREVLLGLQHAHSRGVIHRDLKLTNIMLVEMTGTENLIKILDFGLARITGVDEEMSLTEGMVAGTPSYMSPEQALGKKTDQRSDIYSAGVILYVLCTGKRPFTASNTTALLRMQVQDPAPAPRKLAPGKRISEALERVILRALEKKPIDRYQNVTEFLTALDDTQEGQETLTPTVLRDRRPRRWRTMFIAAAACIALGATGALFARAHFLRLRSDAVGAYQRWTGPDGKPGTAAHERAAGTVAAAGPAIAPSSAPSVGPATPLGEVAPPAALDAAVAPAAVAPSTAKPATNELPNPPEPTAPEPAHAPAVHAPEPAASPPPSTTEPPSRPAPAAASHPRAAAHEPLAHDAREWRQQIEGLIADGKINPAKTQLRDHIAVEKNDAWAHLRLGDIYADPYHYRRDAFREWDSALALDPGLKGDAAFRKSLCETLDATDGSGAQQFLAEHFGAQQTPTVLMACVRAATDVTRIENAARLIEAIAGAERPEIGMAAMRILDVGKTCAQKKAAVELIRRVHYLKARGALIKLDRVRLAHPTRPPAAIACFGTSIAEAIEQLK